MHLNLNLNYVVDDEDRKNPNFATNSAVTITLLRTAMNADKKGSKERDAVRTRARVTNALTKASNAKASELDLDENELKCVRDSLKGWMADAGIPASLTGWFEELLTTVEALLDKPAPKPA